MWLVWIKATRIEKRGGGPMTTRAANRARRQETHTTRALSHTRAPRGTRRQAGRASSPLPMARRWYNRVLWCARPPKQTHTKERVPRRTGLERGIDDPPCLFLAEEQRRERQPRAPRGQCKRTVRTGAGGKTGNDPSAGSPTETLLRLLLPLNDKVWTASRGIAAGEPAALPQSGGLTGSFNR